MDLLVTTTCTAILLLLMIVIGKPLRTAPGATRGGDTASGRHWLRLASERDAVLAALRELDFDRAVGKVSDEDYGDQYRALEMTAMAALRALDELGGADVRTVETRILEEVEETRRLAHSAVVASAPTCPSCGKRRLVEHRFCPHCGGSLAAVK